MTETILIAVLILAHTTARALADTTRGNPRFNWGTWFDWWHLFGLTTSYLLPGYLLLRLDVSWWWRAGITVGLAVLGIVIWAEIKRRFQPDWEGSPWLPWTWKGRPRRP